MKKILPLLFIATMFLIACNQVERIQSLSQLEPALRKHVGNPCKIDTMLEDKEFFITYNSIHYNFDSVPDVSFEHLVDFLSIAYDAEPVITIDLPRRRAEFIPLKEHPGAYMIQVNDYWNGNAKDRYLSLCIIDINYELVIPSSSQTPQRVVPSK